MWSLPSFGVDELETCSVAVRGLGSGAGTMEEVGGRIVRCLYDGFVDDTGQRATVLVRFYTTHRLDRLPAELQAFARSAAGDEAVEGSLRCLTLVATVGDEPAWCDRRRSADHQAIPLSSPAAVERLPMVSKLLDDLGLELDDVIDPDPADALRRHHRSYGVFFVPDARGSHWVPAQQTFVEPYGVRSVVGLGGVLPSGEMFAVIAFARVVVSERAADVLRSLAPAIKAAAVPVTYRVF